MTCDGFLPFLPHSPPFPAQSERRKILDSLTPDDTKMLMETEDEVYYVLTKNKVSYTQTNDFCSCAVLNILMSLFSSQFSHCGSFERVYPSPTAGKYRRFFETEVRRLLCEYCEPEHYQFFPSSNLQRYYNILLTEWAAKYSKNPRKGIYQLQLTAG